MAETNRAKRPEWLDERLGSERRPGVPRPQDRAGAFRHRLVLLRRHHAVPVRHPGAAPASCCCSTTAPRPTEAYESVQFIVTRVQFGWLVRSIHSWSANLMILAAFVHMFSVVFLHAYRRPRELTWLSGIALLGLALGFGFSGYLLPWNTISLLRHEGGHRHGGRRCPWIGPTLARFLRGGDDVGGATLTRFFGFHVAVLPGITTCSWLLHLALVQKFGISMPPKWVDVGANDPPDAVLPELLPARADGLVRSAGGAGGAGRAVPVGTGREGRSLRFGARGNPPGVVFPGAVLHAEADSEPRAGRSRANCSGMIGFGLLAAWWVVLPFWATTREGALRDAAGHRGGRAAARLPGHFLRSGVLAMRTLLGTGLLLLWRPARAAKDSCIECHSALDGAQSAAAATQNDIHGSTASVAPTATAATATPTTPQAAMSRAKGFIGKPARTAVPKLCARCHSDANLMHKYKPQQRVDQLQQYLTSVHGKRIAAGDTAVANCVDCHGVHGIREVQDALSPVHPLRLPETCARCHADPKHMAKYKIETNQFAEYRKSVHWEALAKRGDLSAPTCASCHGNHGATPPQVSSVAAVCGTCHVLLENLYRKSPHEAVFAI